MKKQSIIWIFRIVILLLALGNTGAIIGLMNRYNDLTNGLPGAVQYTQISSQLMLQGMGYFAQMFFYFFLWSVVEVIFHLNKK